eukprot:1601636-Amphidinium_carterae.1
MLQEPWSNGHSIPPRAVGRQPKSLGIQNETVNAVGWQPLLQHELAWMCWGDLHAYHILSMLQCSNATLTSPASKRQSMWTQQSLPPT